MGTTAVAKRTFREEVARYAPRMIDTAAVRGAASDREQYVQRQIALAALAAQKTPALAQCDPQTVAGAMIRHCATGLEIGQTAHLVPFGKDCTYIVGANGLVELMLRTGHVRDVRARAVYEKDHFRIVQGLEERLEHEPALRDRGDLVGYYAVAVLRHGYPTFEYMSDEDVEKIRSKARSGNSPAWKDHRAEMGKKTVIRRLAKRMPQSEALRAALAAEEPTESAPADDYSAPLPSMDAALGIERPRAIMAPRDLYDDEHAPPAGRGDVDYDLDDDAPDGLGLNDARPTPPDAIRSGR